VAERSDTITVHLIWNADRIEFSFRDPESIAWARDHADEIDAVIKKMEQWRGGEKLEFAAGQLRTSFMDVHFRIFV
jgi:hypothetical protein